MKITVETTDGGACNAESEAWESFPAMTITWQEGKGTKRNTATFAFESQAPTNMLRAAYTYFAAQADAEAS